MIERRQDDTVSRVAAAFLNDRGAGMGVIEIEEQEGTITLKGNVESEAASSTAESIALQQDGVVKVINELITNVE